MLRIFLILITTLIMAEETKSQPVVSEGLDEKDLLGTWVLVSSRFTSAEEVAAFETPHRLVFTYGAFVYQPDKSRYACQEKEGKVVFVDPWEPEEPVKFVLQADGTLREDLDDGDYADYHHLTTAKPQHVSEKVGKFLGEWEQRETKSGNAKTHIKPGKGGSYHSQRGHYGFL
jgi:hypothetical protein